jgi:hypothetical protein
LGSHTLKWPVRVVFIATNQNVAVGDGCWRWAHRTVRCATGQCPVRRHVIQTLGHGAGRPLRHPHVSESGGGNSATGRRRGRTGRPWGKKPGRRWARRRFAAGGLVLGQWGGALARGGASEPRGGLNLARGGCPRGGGGAPRRGSPSVSFGRGIGAGEWCSEFAAK